MLSSELECIRAITPMKIGFDSHTNAGVINKNVRFCCQTAGNNEVRLVDFAYQPVI